MEKTGQVDLGHACAAVQLQCLVDDRINGGAREEYAAATSDTQASGADLGEGSAFLDGVAVEFTPQDKDCGTCGGVARLNYDGSVEAPQCGVSGHCELEWANRYPGSYADGQGNMTGNRLFCGAEIGCSAVIGFTGENGSIVAKEITGECEIASRGKDWISNGKKEWIAASLVSPELGVPEFDGEGSGREKYE